MLELLNSFARPRPYTITSIIIETTIVSDYEQSNTIRGRRGVFYHNCGMCQGSCYSDHDSEASSGYWLPLTGVNERLNPGKRLGIPDSGALAFTYRSKCRAFLQITCTVIICHSHCHTVRQRYTEHDTVLTASKQIPSHNIPFLSPSPTSPLSLHTSIQFSV